LDGSVFYLNAELIEAAEARPDTVITLIDGKHFVVQQSVVDVVDRVIEYQQAIHQKRLIDGWQPARGSDPPHG
jgi:flagellar protein FlbD